MPTPTGNRTHDASVLAAEVTRQGALKSASTQPAVRTVDIAYFRSVLASAKANGIQPGQFITALMELGTGGA
jgi:hypothetical protein